jgi:hypothetical protein
MHTMSRVSLGMVLLIAFYGDLGTAWGQIHFRDRWSMTACREPVDSRPMVACCSSR